MAWGIGVFQSLLFLCHGSEVMVLQLIPIQAPVLQEYSSIHPHCLSLSAMKLYTKAIVLIVDPLLVSKAETLNRRNSFSSGFMPHSKHIIPAISFSLTFGQTWTYSTGAFSQFLFSHGPISVCRIIFPIGLASGNFLLCSILEVCYSLALWMLTSHLSMSYTKWKSLLVMRC